jgi:hypothetical protein
MTDSHTEPDWKYQHEMDVYRTERVAKAQIFSAHLSAVAAFSVMAVNAIILANSTAAGAVLVFIATLWGKPEIDAVFSAALSSVKLFAGGTALGIVSAALSYLTQYAYSLTDVTDQKSKSRTPLLWVAGCLHVLAVLAALGGIAAFSFGAWQGVEALESSKGGLTAATRAS